MGFSPPSMLIMEFLSSFIEVYRGLRAKRWLFAAMAVEFLSLAGAISAIPGSRVVSSHLGTRRSWHPVHMWGVDNHGPFYLGTQPTTSK